MYPGDKIAIFHVKTHFISRENPFLFQFCIYLKEMTSCTKRCFVTLFFSYLGVKNLKSVGKRVKYHFLRENVCF